MNNEDAAWFAPKRFGYGAGLPISWQGWVITAGYVALAALDALLIRYSWIGFVSVLTMLTAGFILIAARTTKGGWRWRWGHDD